MIGIEKAIQQKHVRLMIMGSPIQVYLGANVQSGLE